MTLNLQFFGAESKDSSPQEHHLTKGIKETLDLLVEQHFHSSIGEQRLFRLMNAVDLALTLSKTIADLSTFTDEEVLASIEEAAELNTALKTLLAMQQPPVASFLTAGRVRQMLHYCLHESGEEMKDPVVATAFTTEFHFHRERITEKADDIIKMLLETSDDVMESKTEGLGGSIIKMSYLKDGYQWGGPRSTEALFAMGLAIGWTKIPLPPELTMVGPNGLPHVVILDTKKVD